MKGRLLTVKMLREKDACREQLLRFKQIFGDSVVVTPELAVLCREKFSVSFLTNFMTRQQADAVYRKANKLWSSGFSYKQEARIFAEAFIRAGRSAKKKTAPKKKAKRS